MMEKYKSKFDVKELKRLKKEKKKLKEKELLERLDKTKSLQASLAAKPVPKVNHSFSSLLCFSFLLPNIYRTLSLVRAR